MQNKRLFLHRFFDNIHAPSTDTLVVIPTSFCVAKPPLEAFNEKEEKQILIDDCTEAGISLVLPYDDNIFKGIWCYEEDGLEFTHCPCERAAMLYEAITDTDKNGYKYHHIFITGGSNAEDVINELERLIKDRGPLPRRAENLKVYGFSDGAQLHHYLGQRHICTPVYYSMGLNALIYDILKPTSGVARVSPLNKAAAMCQKLEGFTLPGRQIQTENRPIHQTRFFKEPYQTNFLIIEPTSLMTTDLYLKLLKKYKNENITLVLSEDVSPSIQHKVARLTPQHIPVFYGAPTGHGNCLEKGKPITLFARASIEQETPDHFVMKWADRAAPQAASLSQNPLRLCKARKTDGKSTTVLAQQIEVDTISLILNLKELAKRSNIYTIDLLSRESGTRIIQFIESTLKGLLEAQIIDPGKLTQLHFHGEQALDKNQEASLKTRLNYFAMRYCPKLTIVSYNHKFYPIEKARHTYDQYHRRLFERQQKEIKGKK